MPRQVIDVVKLSHSCLAAGLKSARPHFAPLLNDLGELLQPAAGQFYAYAAFTLGLCTALQRSWHGCQSYRGALVAWPFSIAVDTSDKHPASAVNLALRTNECS